jgi:hypothetical protein
MFMLPDGRIFTLDSFGKFVRSSISKQVEPWTLHALGEGNNEDGRRTSCTYIAFEHLGLPLAEVKPFRDADVATPYALVERILADAGAQLLNCHGTVAEFVRTHPSGKYFIEAPRAVNAADDCMHVLALVDGVASNVNFNCASQPVRRVWAVK